MFIDLDYFKDINDTHGHLAGDQVLRATAEAVLGAVRQEDVCGRYGGEEFVIVMPDTPALLAGEIAERLRTDIEDAAFKVAELTDPVAVTTSIGVATLDEGHGQDAASLLKIADRALYEAKNSGRNRVIAKAA